MPSRAAVLDALTDCVTQPEAEAALRMGRAWMREHPDDHDVAHVMEGADLVRTAWDLPLDDWSQFDRDELLRITGRTG